MQIRQHIEFFVDALRLSRVNNLIIIFLTQYFSAIFLLYEKYAVKEILLDYKFFFFVFSTIIIAASGYYINDYYDIKIDLINKPKKVIVGKQIKRRPVLFAHLVFNGVGILMGTWVSIWIGLVNLGAAFLLWLYSNQLKRMPFVGNLTVALLTGTTLIILNIYFQTNSLLIYTYAFFAFGINLIREIIKDIEDMEGDASFGSNSLPVMLGIRKTKYLLYFLVVIFIGSLTLFLKVLNNIYLSIYFLVLTLPFIHFMFVLIRADTKKEFTYLSKYCKWIILAGIMSMIVLRF